MPFDFINYKHYSINYFDLYNELNSQIILNDKNMQNEYLKAWIRKLQICDAAIAQELNTREAIFNFSLFLQSEPEIFQLPIKHINNNIFLHFRISALNEMISKYKKNFQEISINEFTEKDGVIKWSPINTDVESYANATDPLIMVYYFNDNYTNLVIDGNHRLTYKVKHNIKNVHVLNISEEGILKANAFSSGFDRYYYIMNNELDYMSYATHSKHANARELVELSYLIDEKFKLGKVRYS